jgi:Ca2+-binding RTX toxin-like protein
VENLKFADGTVWDVATIKTKVLTSTAGNDTLTGYATNHTINAGDGNDTVYGQAGDDVLDGGTGADNVQGGDGNDTVRGGTGNDTLYGGNGNDSLQGNENNDTLNGDAGNDTLDGGSGNDYLSGGTGADVYLFGTGSGQDTVYNYDSDAVGTNADTVLLGSGIATTGVTLTRSSNDLIILLNGSDDSLRVQSYFDTDGASSYVVENLKFADGTVWNYATVKANLSTATPPASITVNGTAANETLKGGLGNDTVYGNAGNDTLDGGLGNDTLDSGAGNDTYLFGKGSGKDTISAYDGTVGKVDLIQLGADVLTTDVVLKREGDTLVLSINGSTDTLRVNSYFYNDATYGYQVEQIKFADGTIWDVNAVKTKVLTATSGNDTLYGYASADTVSGLAGDDTVYAKAGNDTLDGGAGEDQLYGEDGDDLIRGGTQNDRLDGGNGADNLQGQDGDDTLNGQAGNDTLDGGLGNDLMIGGKGDDTYFWDSNDKPIVELANEGTDTLVIWRENETAVLPAFVENGLVIAVDAEYGASLTGNSLDNVLTGGADTFNSLYGAAGNDTLIGGGTLGNWLSGDEGNDRLEGSAGNDGLQGGLGNDTLIGGAGNDTYWFGIGQGVDTINSYDPTVGKQDAVYLGAARQADVSFSRAANNLEVLLNGSADKLVVQNWYLGSQHHIEKFHFANGTLLDSQVQNLVSAMASFVGPVYTTASDLMPLNSLMRNDMIAVHTRGVLVA